MTYQQITYEERIILITLKRQGLSIREIARQINRHFSTIYRELNRNRCRGVDNAYRAFKANRRAVARRRRSRRNNLKLVMKFQTKNQKRNLYKLKCTPEIK